MGGETVYVTLPRRLLPRILRTSSTQFTFIILYLYIISFKIGEKKKL